MATIEEYWELREALQGLCGKLLDFLPDGPKGAAMIRRAAKELGYSVKGNSISFESEEYLDQLHDFVLFEPDSRGLTVAARYLESGPELPPKEAQILRAALVAKTHLFEILDWDRPQKRIFCRDLLHEEPNRWITDVAMSETLTRPVLLFARVFDVAEFSFMSGAAVCFDLSETDLLLKKYQPIARIKHPHLHSRKRYALFIRLAKQSLIKIRYE